MKPILSTIIIITIFLFSLTSAMAQVDSSLVKEVEVVKAYMPSVANAQKISANPLISDTITYTPEFDYQIYSREIPIDKSINHLPVVKLGALPRYSSNIGHLRAGFGNALTPYGELFINNSPTRNTDFGMHLYHFSSQPTVKINNDFKVKTPYSKNMARIFFRNNLRRAALDWDLSYLRDRQNYYGFPETDSLIYVHQELNSETLNMKQVFSTVSAKTNIRNTNARANLDYNIGLNYNYLWNATGQSSHHAGYNGLFSRKYRSHNFNLNTYFDYYNDLNIEHNFDETLTNHQFFNVKMSPDIFLKRNNIELLAGFNLATLIGADSILMWHISPKIDFTYNPLDGALSLFAGANGGFNANNYMQAYQNNQYMNYMLDLKPSEEIINIYGGFKGTISNAIAYKFSVAYSINQNEAYFYQQRNESARDTIVQNMFSADYDDVNRLTLGGKLRYSKNNVTIDLRGNYYVYESKYLRTLSHMPDFDAELNALVAITPKITANLNATVIGPREAIYKQNRFFTTPFDEPIEVHHLNTIINISLGADYALSNKLNFFINAQNILNQNYEYWHGYNSPGLLIMLGARYTF